MIIFALLETSCFVLSFLPLSFFPLTLFQRQLSHMSEVQLPSSGDTFTTQMGQSVFCWSACSFSEWKWDPNGCVHLYKYCLCYYPPHYRQMTISFHIARVDCIRNQQIQTTYFYCTRVGNNHGSFLYHLKCDKKLGLHRQSFIY